jgi:hypothetical protein
MMTFDEVISRFDVRSRSNGTAQALCNAHKDREPSLTISRADHGGILFYCHAGCETEHILEAAGLTWDDVQPDDGSYTTPRRAVPRRAAPSQQRTPKAEPPPFWFDQRAATLREAQEALRAAPESDPLLTMARNRDGLLRETLELYGCGILRRADGAFLAFPYDTGCQLYRRPDGQRELKAWYDGKEPKNRPKDSFFGLRRLTGKPHLVVAKSPREAMLIRQEIDGIDAIGLPGGERAELSPKQREILRELAAGLTSVLSVLDCKTEADRKTAEAFARSVAEAVYPVPVGRVNVYDATEERCKDLTDAYAMDGPEAIVRILAAPEPIDPPPALSQTPVIPRMFYAALHPELSAACEALREGYERDVFVMGLLPCLTAAMPNIRTKYARRWRSLALMIAIGASAGSGKGTMSLAAETIRPIDESLRERSEYERAEWEMIDPKERKTEPCPPFRRLRIGADSSLRAITDALADNEERGLIFETEIKVLAAALKQDWGDFKGLLLKAAEQEPYERERKEDGPAYLRAPEIAAALSGTPRSFRKWMEDAEDGLFSRFLFYYFEAAPVWYSQFEDDSDEALESALAIIGETLQRMFNALTSRAPDERGKPTPFYLNVEPEARRYVDRNFAALLSHVDENERPELYASVKRGAFQAVRIAGALAAYRLAAEGADLSTAKTYSPNLDEVRAAVSLMRCLISHAAHLADSFAPDPAETLESEERRRYYDALPGAFETAEALEIGKQMGMHPRKAERALSAYVRKNILTRESRGVYRKPEPKSVPAHVSAMSDPSEVTEASESIRGAP